MQKYLKAFFMQCVNTMLCPLFWNRSWIAEVKRAKDLSKKPRLSKVLALFFWKPMIFCGLLYAFDSWVIQ